MAYPSLQWEEPKTHLAEVAMLPNELREASGVLRLKPEDKGFDYLDDIGPLRWYWLPDSAQIREYLDPKSECENPSVPSTQDDEGPNIHHGGHNPTCCNHSFVIAWTKVKLQCSKGKFCRPQAIILLFKRHSLTVVVRNVEHRGRDNVHLAQFETLKNAV